MNSSPDSIERGEPGHGIITIGNGAEARAGSSELGISTRSKDEEESVKNGRNFESQVIDRGEVGDGEL
jgi:hypothetical protein